MLKNFIKLFLVFAVCSYAYADEVITEYAEKTLAVLNNELRSLNIDRQLSRVESLNLRTKKISNLGTPTLSTDATNKAYVDSITGTKDYDETGISDGMRPYYDDASGTIKWNTIPTIPNLTYISSSSGSNAVLNWTVNITTGVRYRIVFNYHQATGAGGSSSLGVKFNSDSGVNYSCSYFYYDYASVLTNFNDGSAGKITISPALPVPTWLTGWFEIESIEFDDTRAILIGGATSEGFSSLHCGGKYDGASAITSFTFYTLGTGQGYWRAHLYKYATS